MRSLAELRAEGGRALVAGDVATARDAYRDLRGQLVQRYGEANEHVAAVDEMIGGVERVAGDRAAARVAFERARAAYASLESTSARSLDTVLAHLAPLSAEELAARPRLAIRHAAREWVVENDLFFIGRGYERVHLWIHSPMLSRIHARVLWEATSKAWIFEDCRSENGSYIAGGRVDRRTIEGDDAFVLGAPAVVLTMKLGTAP